jgi:hypothetical protein
MSSTKRKSPPAASASSSSHAAKVHVTADRRDQPIPTPAAEQPHEEESDQEFDADSADHAAPMSEQTRYMQQAYQVTSKVAPRPAGAVGVPSYVDKPLTAVQKAFVNHGLARWTAGRTAWVARDDAAKSSKAVSSSSATAAAAAPSTGKTPLPHALSSHATPKVASPSNPNSDAGSGTDDEEYVAADSSDEDSDINLDVPRIIQARESYSKFEPRVKLSHMVDILNVCWEEESE